MYIVIRRRFSNDAPESIGAFGNKVTSRRLPGLGRHCSSLCPGREEQTRRIFLAKLGREARIIFWRLTPKVPQRKHWQSGAARQASTGQSTRDEGSARWAAQKGPAGSAGRLSVQNSHSGCFEQGITLIGDLL